MFLSALMDCSEILSEILVTNVIPNVESVQMPPFQAAHHVLPLLSY